MGATGALTLVTANGQSNGVTSVARNSAGDYTFTLQDAWVRMYGARVSFDESGGSAPSVPAAPFAFVKAYNLASSAKTIEVVFTAASGASGALVATDPANHEAFWIEFVLQNSTAV